MKFLSYIYFLLLRTRYNFTISGLERIDSKKQYLVFPNHEALVDPQIVYSIIGQKIKLSPVITESFYNMPVLNILFRSIGAVSMGDITNGVSGLKEINSSFKEIEKAIQDGKNILLYPAGQLYSQGYEIIKGKKAAFNIVQKLPKQVEILTIRTTGLWGSSWSKAWNGNTPDFFSTFIKSIFIIISNIIFFVPKRQVNIDIINYTKQLKQITDLNIFNQFLEDFYNQKGKEEIKYKKHFFYFNNILNKQIPKINGSAENIRQIDESIITEEIKNVIFKKISEMKNISEDKMKLSLNLIIDLYFDSLDLSEIKSFVQIFFPKSSNTPILDLKTIGDLCYMAMGKLNNDGELKSCDWQDINNKDRLFYDIILQNKDNLGSSTNILSLFKEIFKQNKKDDFIYDDIFGLQSKKDFLIKAYLISDYIKKIDGKYIGIMIPSVASASLIIISTYLAGKIPVMLNWTVGETALLHCVKFANINTVLTSSNFYNKIKNNGTEKIKDKYLFLEDLLKDIKTITKLKSVIKSFFFNIPQIKYEDIAVMLFTSGSESLPKAVSLTHKNLISDILGGLGHFSLSKKDILIGFLPPFHSFGFTINTILPLISGLRVVYTPDPNDSKTISNLIKHTKITTLTATPTFLKMILSVIKQNDLKTLKYAVVGAEKCPESLVENFKNYCPEGQMLEGYGITECSPVISINPIGKAKLGSVGLPIKGSNIKIFSLENIQELEKNKEGMIYFSGENIFSGYLDKDLENPFEEINGIKYYKTGDLGYLDDDGYLYITGRLKRFVKIAGEMISLPFIEGTIIKKYGSDIELKIAIEAIENKGTVKIVLFTVESLDLNEVSTYLRESGVSNLVKISEIIKIESIPVLGTGKIDYKVLKNMIKIN